MNTYLWSLLLPSLHLYVSQASLYGATCGQNLSRVFAERLVYRFSYKLEEGVRNCALGCVKNLLCETFSHVNGSCQQYATDGNVYPADSGLEAAKVSGCETEPTYVNQGAIRKRKMSKPGYPVVLEYECDGNAKEKYKYFSGPREALCDDHGNWTLPAMNCVPTSCYTKLIDKSGRTTVMYDGETNRTKGGKECQAWMEDEPHRHPRKYKSYSGCTGCGFVNETGNKCRDMRHLNKPWCFTKDPDKRHEYCDVPECNSEQTCARPPILRCAPAVRAELIGRKLHVTYRCHPSLKYISGGNVSTCDMKTGLWDWSDLLCASEDCYYYDRDQWKGAVYHGSVSRTETGRKCQRWDQKWPQWHKMTANKFHGIRSLSELGNVCRDPDDNGAPWCYTDPKDQRTVGFPNVLYISKI